MTPIQALTLLGLIAEEVRLEAGAVEGDKGPSGAIAGRTQGKALTDEQAAKLFNDG